MLDERMKQFEEEKIRWEQQRQAAAQEGKAFDDEEPTMDEERERAWQVGYPCRENTFTFVLSKGRQWRGCSDTRLHILRVLYGTMQQNQRDRSDRLREGSIELVENQPISRSKIRLSSLLEGTTR